MVEPCLIDASKCRTVQGFQVDTLHFSPETGTRGDHLRRIGVAQGVGLPFRTQIHTTVPDMLCLHEGPFPMLRVDRINLIGKQTSRKMRASRYGVNNSGL